VRRDLSPWAYRKGDTPLHRLPPALKLILLLLLSSGVFISPLWMIPGGLCILTGAFLGGLKPWDLLRGSRGIALLALLVLLFHSLGSPREPGTWRLLPFLGIRREGFLSGLLFGVRMFLSFAIGTLFFTFTTLGEIRRTLGALENRFFPGKIRIALGFSLMLMFIPRFFELWDASNLAWEARGGGKGPARLRVLIPLVTERMIEAAGETAEALEARGGV